MGSMGTIIEAIEASDNRKRNGNWIAACGESEVPFWTRTGRRLLYCYQPSTGRHAYLDCGTDIILSDTEATEALAVY